MARNLRSMVHWRLKDLVAWIQEEFTICMDEMTLGRTLRAMGYRKLSARPRHHAGPVGAGRARAGGGGRGLIPNCAVRDS